MKLDRVFVGEIENGLITDRSAADHVLKVLRLKAGDVFAGYDGRRELILKIRGVEAGELEVEVAEEREIPPVASGEIIIAAALIKSARWEWLLEKVVEVGAGVVAPMFSERSVVKRGGEGKRARWEKIMMSAAAQSAGRMPELREPVEAKEFFSGCLGKNRFIMREGGRPLVELAQEISDGEIVVAVGPEGGWTDGELEAAAAAGFIPAGLGNRILRTETAAACAVAIAAAACRKK